MKYLVPYFKYFIGYLFIFIKILVFIQWFILLIIWNLNFKFLSKLYNDIFGAFYISKVFDSEEYRYKTLKDFVYNIKSTAYRSGIYKED